MGLIVPPRAAALLGENAEKWQARVLRDFETIKPWLPQSVTTIVDIGCGLAGVDVLLARETRAKEIVLVDGDGTGYRKMGFVPGTSAWFDVGIGAELVKKNLRGKKVEARAADPNLTIPCDLLISLKSWGHHYTVDEYLGLAQRSLRPGGRLILDIRNGTKGGVTLATRGFNCIGVAYWTVKADRMVFERVS